MVTGHRYKVMLEISVFHQLDLRCTVLDTHPGWNPIASNAHHLNTILTQDFKI
jgi:hypothetical protein